MRDARAEPVEAQPFLVARSRARPLVLATVGLCGTAAAPAAQSPPSWTPYDRPAQYGVVTEQNVPITMSDGVQLNAIVYRPDAPGRSP